MSEKHNIEDLFRSEFDGYTEAPSNGVWNSINRKMTGPRIESMYKNAFKGFKVAPAEQTWRRIAAAVWFNKFIHFSPFSFNVYYLGIIITAVVGTVITVNNNPDLNFVHFSDKQETTELIDVKEIKVDNESNESFELRNANPSDFELSDNNITDETNRLDNKTSTIDYTSVEPENNVEDLIALSNIEETNTQEQNTVETNNDIQNKQIEIIETSTVDIETNTNTAELTTNQETNSANILDINLDRLVNINKYTLTYQPTPFDIADLVINGIPKQDEITYDTIGVDYHGDPILKEKSYFAIDAYYSPYCYIYNTSLLNTELVNNLDLYNKNLSPQLSFSAGLGLAYSYNNFRIETGIGYQKLHETFNSKTEEIETNTYTQYEHFENEVWDYTTIYILDLDEYIQGNIVYYQYTDSLMTLVPDSTLVSVTDTTIISKEMNADNNYQYIDIPLVLGYEFKMGNFCLTPKTGVISSILINRSGTYYDIENNNIGSAENCPNTKLMFDYYAALNIQYQIGEHAGIYLEPHLRADINSMYDKSYAISQKGRKLGIKTGVYIKF